MSLHCWRRPDAAKRPREGPVAILGLGDVHRGDDGLGPAVIGQLRTRYLFDEGAVRIAEEGKPGFDFATFLAGARAVILIGAVHDALEGPGTLRWFRRETFRPPGPRRALERFGDLQDDFLLLGAVPGCLDATTGLTPQVHAAVPLLVQGAIVELERLGVRARQRRGAKGEAGPTQKHI